MPDDHCMMPYCTWEVFKRSGLCDKHYAQAYPEDQAELAAHIRRENKMHPMSMARARADHERRRKYRDGQVLSPELVAQCFQIPAELLAEPRSRWRDMGRMDKDGLK